MNPLIRALPHLLPVVEKDPPLRDFLAVTFVF